MQGPDGLARILARALADGLPARLALLEAANGPTVDNTNPLPALIHWAQLPRDVLSSDDFPLVMVVVGQAPKFTVVNPRLADGSRVYDVRYQVGLFTWLRGTGYDQLTSARARLALGIREVLLATPEPSPGLRVDESTWRERYGDVRTPEGMAFSLAGAQTTFEAVLAETLAPVVGPVGTADAVTTTITVMP